MVDSAKNQSWELGSDLPLENPADDFYGYAPFASKLANVIVENKSPKGLVVAVHGKWGSGKSSLLNFIKHDLQLIPVESRPVILDFNPWWFEGRDQIATQLLAEFSSQWPDKFAVAKDLANAVGKYSKEIASAAATFTGYSWLMWPVALLAQWFPKLKVFLEPKGVPQLKKKVEKALKASGKRFVFFVDDIDRLTPDEACDFFRAIKALADFPDVIYVLFFDREEVAKALTASLGMDGEAYLEKIVQAPFNLPAVDRQMLREKLFSGLNLIIETHSMPFDFDQQRWNEVFYDGLNLLINKPRDIVRVLNAISVLYPPVAGEVNPIDFIALEFLRVFEPAAYGSIRDAKEFFCGLPSHLDYKRADEKAYFEAWNKSLPEKSRGRITNLVGRLFPKVERVLSTSRLISSDDRGWRKDLRPCSADNFDVYFQFGVPPGHVSRAELDRIVGQVSSDGVAALLLEAKEIVFPDGHSKARDLIERLRDLDQLAPDQAANIVKALVDNGHLLLRTDDELSVYFIMPNRWRIDGLVSKQLERIEVADREALLVALAESSPGLWSLVGIADDALRSKQDPSKAAKALLELSDGFADDLVKRVGRRLNEASLDELLSMPELDYIVHRWGRWGDVNRIAKVFQPMLADDDKLLTLLDKFVRTGRRESGGRVSETYRLLMGPLDLAVGVQAIAQRVNGLLVRPNLSLRQRMAINSFNQGLNAMEEGKDPDNMHFMDHHDE